MDLPHTASFVESLRGTLAFVDGEGSLLAATSRFREVFPFKKLLETTFTGLDPAECGASNLHMEIFSQMSGGLKDFADMTIRWRGQSYLFQFIASRCGAVFEGVLINVTDISDRVISEERSRKELNDLMLFQKVAFGREKKMAELRQKIEELTRQLNELGAF